jgi:hypothetical protein
MAAGRRLGAAGLLLAALLDGPAWGGEDTLTFQERLVAVVRQSEPPATIAVIRLHHRDAEEMAALLRPALPPGTTVVPDPPSNSLIVTVQPVPGATATRPE